jgi:hypothetical protein
MPFLAGKTLSVIGGDGHDGFSHAVPFTTVSALSCPF